MTDPKTDPLQHLLNARFADAPDVEAPQKSADRLARLAAHGSCRSFTTDPIPDAVLQTLCAVALCAPSKSDLQQRDIILLKSGQQRTALAELVPKQPWIAQAPMIAVFCGNNRRQRLMHDWKNIPFANDHFDAPFNAAADAAIALGAFVTAAEAVGLGCCPISGVRNRPRALSELLALPPYVFPFAGLAVGVPEAAPAISQRLPLDVTCHTDRYDETGLRTQIAQYDAMRRESQPYPQQRRRAQFAESAAYGWSDDKVRQYSVPERETFGAYMRAQGFKFD
ncbi:nitroreductase family protein [Sulfitobacter sp. S190]|uniref:nitroreductase family protein n=1 Tax=Sulfitobacter sp. S190 TaxID=2867022 RepID=UPI0021A3685F|nr:nitroreductase family protein [Sulfitobacter sp. S190]UWR21608.1 nitroreductase family protein [Sulfitobacter sp. S190]